MTDTDSTSKAVDALVARAVAIANEILQGTLAPYDGAKALWRMRSQLAEVEEALRIFVGLASD